MEIVIAAAGPELGSPVAKRFGHAPWYLCVDRDGETLEVIENVEPEDHSHGVIPQLVARGAEVFITGNIGPKAFELIRELNGRVALARNMSGIDALRKLQRGELVFLDRPTLAHSVHDQASSRPARDRS